MSKTSWLQRRGATYYLRAKVPLDIVDTFGKKEVVRSLKTKDLRVARERLKIEALQVDQEFAACRHKVDTAEVRTSKISEDEIRRVVLIWFHQTDRDAARRVQSSSYTDEEQNTAVENLEIDISFNRDATNPDTLSFVQAEMAKIQSEYKFSIPFDDARYSLLFSLVQRGLIERDRRKMKRITGDYAFHSFDPLFRTVSADGPSPELPVTRSPTLAELVSEYETDPSRRDLSPKSITSYRVIFRALKELLGEEKRIDEISRDDCKRLRDVVMSLPPNATKRYSGMPLEDVAEKAKAEKLDVVSPGTVKSYLNSLSALFNFAVREGYMNENPAAGIRGPRNSRKKKDARLPFSTAELKSIFSAPLYTGCVDDERHYAKAGTNKPRRHRFWVPLISLYSGMRLNECCQLLVDDIKKVNGLDVIRVEGDEDEGKRTKNSNSDRYIPVHSELKKIGLLDYVAERRRSGEKKLFPNAPVGKDEYHSSPYSKWYGRFLKSVGVKSPRKSFHSLRHSFRDAQREADIPEDRAEAINGRGDEKTVGEDQIFVRVGNR